MKMTPDRRLSLAFWLGTFQAACWYLLIESYREVGRGDTTWLVWLIPWLVLLYFFMHNNLNFRKETTWMTIKNPDKVGGDGWVYVGDLKNSRPPPPPPAGRPPPPPAPPKRSLGGGR